MCTHEIEFKNEQRLLRSNVIYRYIIIPAILVFSILPLSLFASGFSEEYKALISWQLPDNAVEIKALKEIDSLWYRDGNLFSGWLFERHPEGQLLRAAKYHKGKAQGPSLMWYPDGTPQMSANYYDGALNGRFLGWYPNGGVIYDLYIKRGTFAGDNLFELGDPRSGSEDEYYEGEGRDNDGSYE